MTGPSTTEELHERASRPTAKVKSALQTGAGDIMVLGAGGKMGFHLTNMIKRSLDEIGSPRRVIAVSRFGTPGSTRLFDRHGIPVIAIDMMAENAMSQLPDAEDIFFLAGVKFGTDSSPELLQRINIDLPRKVGKRFPGSRIVALSTGCVYPFASVESGGSVETDPTDPLGDYAKSCVGREESFSNCNARVSLIRLNYSVDLRYGVLVDIARKVSEEIPVDISTGFVNVIWQGDANAYIIQSLDHASNPPFVLNVTGSKMLRIRDVADQFGRLIGKEALFEGMERPTAWLSNAALCHKLFGAAQIDENELIGWVAGWIQHGGELLNKPTHFEVRDGKY